MLASPERIKNNFSSQYSLLQVAFIKLLGRHTLGIRLKFL